MSRRDPAPFAKTFLEAGPPPPTPVVKIPEPLEIRLLHPIPRAQGTHDRFKITSAPRPLHAPSYTHIKGIGRDAHGITLFFVEGDSYWVPYAEIQNMKLSEVIDGPRD